MNNTIFVYPCNYQATSKKLIFFLSLFLGLCGCDWCWLSVGVNSAYVCLGCFKFLTMGGFGIWWVYDVMALYFGNGPTDGWGFELYDDLTNTGVPTGLTSLPVNPVYVVNGLWVYGGSHYRLQVPGTWYRYRRRYMYRRGLRELRITYMYMYVFVIILNNICIFDFLAIYYLF